MLFFGDRDRVLGAAQARDDLDRLRRAPWPTRRLARRARCVLLLVGGAEIAQGLADAGARAAARRWSAWCVEAARDLEGRRRRAPPPLPATPPIEIRVRVCEGFIQFAVYPEAYARRARALRIARPRVIGVLSIGAALGAAVAAALAAPAPILIRPHGPPWSRAAPRPARNDLGATDAVIVDEGPGVSGSTLAAAARFARASGARTVTVLAAHPNGPSDPARRAAFARLKALPCALDPREVLSWFRAAFGALDALTPTSRAHLCFGALEPPAITFAADARIWRAVFVGLGPAALDRIARDDALDRMGWLARPAIDAHGWRARPLDPEAPRAPTLDALGRYISDRAAAFPCRDADATDRLCAAVQVNAADLVSADAVARWIGKRACMSSARLIIPDGALRLQRWRAHARRLDGADAFARCDLVGAQPLEWDIAGAAVELGASIHTLSARLGASRERTRWLLPAYLAVERGRCVYARATTATPKALAAREARLTRQLQAALGP